MSIKKLKEIKEEFTIKYNLIRTKEFLTEIDEGYSLILKFMGYTINELTNLRKELNR